MHGIVLQTVSWEHYADGDPSVVKGKPREAPQPGLLLINPPFGNPGLPLLLADSGTCMISWILFSIREHPLVAWLSSPGLGGSECRIEAAGCCA